MQTVLRKVAAMDEDKKRRGQVLVLILTAILVVLAVSVFAVDVGYIFQTEATAQNASDAAVLAAVRVMVSERNTGEDEDDARDAAEQEAVAIARANCARSAIDIEFGRYNDSGSFEEFGDGDDDETATAVRAVVARNSEAPGGPLVLFFGPLFGLNTADVSAHATSSIDSNIVGVRGNLAPFAVYEGDLPPIGDSVTIYDHEQLAPGCFGLLNVDGSKNVGSSIYKEWIAGGYQETFELDPEVGHEWVYGGTGFRSALKSALNGRVGDELTVCVYDQVSPDATGTNTKFRVVSFARVTLTDVRLTGNNKYVRARLEEVTNLHDVIVGNTGESPNICKLRLRQ